MSNIYGSPRYEPVSYEASQTYPMKDVRTSGSEKRNYSSRTWFAADIHQEFSEYPSVYNHSASFFSRVGKDWWLAEILAWFVALGSQAIMYHVLKRYNQKAQSDWPYSITVNAFLQIFTTILRGALLVPLSHGISQLKWTWFLQQDRSLDDFVTFDDASRGIWGSLRLIWHQKGIRLASLGAAITILTMATSTFVQQVVSYPSKAVTSVNGTASVSASAYYTDLDGTFDGTGASAYPLSAMKGAFYSGLLGGTIQPIAPTCSTGNCTWPPYASIALCASVTDLTDRLKIADPGDFAIDFRADLVLPNGNNITSSTMTITMQIFDQLHVYVNSGSATYDITSMAYNNTIDPVADIIVMSWPTPSTGEVAGATAFECLLQLCVNTYNTSLVNGVATTTVVDSQNASSLGIALQNFADTSTTSAPPDFNPSITTAGSNTTLTMDGVNYGATDAVILALQVMMGSRFPGYQDTEALTITSDAVLPFISAVGGGLAGVAGLMDNIATAMTNEMRIGTGHSTVAGVAYENVTYIHVDKKWLAYPILLIILTFFFLGGSVYQSHHNSVGIWKGSALATLQVLEETARMELGPVTTSSQMAKAAKTRQFRLRNRAGAWSLYTASSI